MALEYISLTASSPDRAQVQRAAVALREGALVAFPTETVYGLAANAASADAVNRLRELKGRASQQPFTVHIGRRNDWTDFVPSISPLGRRLIKKGWPGPLTIIFQVEDPRQAKAHAALSEPGARSIYSQGSVGIRYPDHAVAEALLAGAQSPIIASSANPAGQPPPLEAGPITESFGDSIDLILDAGPARFRKSSTIVALNGSGYRLVRAGVWDERIIRNLATLHILLVCTGNTCRSPMAEGIFKRMIAEKLGCRPEELAERGIVVRSAGTAAYGGSPASQEAVEVCRVKGIDISGHVTQGLSLELIHPSDYIYTMARHHADVVRSLAPADSSKVTPLHPTEDIVDPAGGSVEDYERVAAKITEALRQRLNEVPL
jgi:protein-tyrosine phosphatase